MIATFYSISALAEDVSSQQPVELELDTILEDLLGHLAVEKDFLGVIDKQGKTLQVMYEGSDEFWLEIPDQSKGGSFGKTVNRSELVTIFQKLPKKISNTLLMGGQFLSWS